MKTFIIFFLLGMSVMAHSQVLTDSLYFLSDDEKKYYHSIDENNAFQLLFFIDEKEGLDVEPYQTEFYSFLDNLNKKKSKKITKRIRKIYDEIHERYFEKYVLNPGFYEIFTKKEFNCVTATALYALAFDYLEIPYEIKQIPTHVYLVVYPNTHHIVFETTSPEEGYITISEKQINKYRNELLASKTLSKKEAKSLDNKALLNDYLLSGKSINLSDLIGIQYYNSSIKYSENEALFMAVCQAEKAFKLYASEDIKSWISLLLFTLIDEKKDVETDEVFCVLLDKLLTYETYEEIDNVILDVYTIKSISMIEEAGNTEGLKRLTKCLTGKIEKQEIKNEILYRYNVLLAEYYYRATENLKALTYLSKSYKPGHKQLNLLIKKCLMQHMESAVSGAKGLDTLDKYENIFPFLKGAADMQAYNVWCYMDMVHYHYSLDEPKKGLEKLNEFRAKYKPNDGKAIYRGDVIALGYGAASTYYVRDDNYKKAKEFLMEGLSYMPESIGLKRKLKAIEERTKY